MKTIELSRGKYTVVDDENYEYLNQWKWYAQIGPNTYYAKRTIQLEDCRKHLLMHRIIMGLKFNDMRQIDHKDHNGLNNLKSNLRICNVSQNRANRPKCGHNSLSRFKGVSWYRNERKWIAQIVCNNKKYFLGYFEIEEEAAKAYDKKAIEFFGKFACTNEMLGLFTYMAEQNQKGG